jgi:PAS domain S-box-containing protein
MNDATRSTARKPDVPEEVQARWQRLVDQAARIAGVSAAIIMRLDEPQLEVFVSSVSEGNPYQKGTRADLDTGLYCETVIHRRAPLLIPDARQNPAWDHNPALEVGMTFYLGYPLKWPDGDIFGTICLLDVKDNPHAPQLGGLIGEIQKVVENDLRLLVEAGARQELLAELQRHRDQLREIVAEKTAELEKSREALLKCDWELAESQRVARLGSWDWDIVNDNHQWSEEIYRIFGLSAQEIKPSYEAFLARVHPDDRQEVDRANREAIANPERPYDTEYRIVRPDGRECVVHARAEVYFDENRRPLHMVGTIQDITERKRAEQVLREREDHFRVLHQTMLQGVVFHAADGKIITMNPAAERILGRSPADFLGAYPEDFKHQLIREDGAPFPVAELPAMVALASGQDQHDTIMGVHNPRQGEYRWISVSAVPLFRPGEDRPYQAYTLFDDITERKQAAAELQQAFDEIKRLKEQLEAENIYLRAEVDLREGFQEIIGESGTVKDVVRKIQQVAPMNATVLLMGETGTGKGLFARALHQASGRRDKPFVKVNCASLPANLIESELFGREKGAFTGATARQIGRFELAHGGTIFLDEIGELLLDLQVKLLRIIEDGELERLGSPHHIRVDVRIIAATNRDLEAEVKQGQFRKDLFYRLNVFPITIPPLRQRREDIPLLVNYYAERFSRSHGKHITRISKHTMQALQDYAWPGNVRELMNVMERAVIVSDGSELRLAEKVDASPINHSQGKEALVAQEIKGLVEMEREHILRTLQETGWRVEGPKGAAKLLAMNPSTLKARMKKLGIKRPGRE